MQRVNGMARRAGTAADDGMIYGFLAVILLLQAGYLALRTVARAFG